MRGGVKFFPRHVDIESMKKLALMMMFGISGVVLSAEEFTIQTISAQKEASITPAFEKKVQKSALPSVKKKEGECNIVTVGKYHSTKEAHHDLKKAKAISKDAFVRTVERTTPKVCESKSATSKTAMKDVNSSAVVPKKEEAIVVVAKPVETKAVEAPHAAPVAVVAPTVPVVAPSTHVEAKAEVPCKAQPCEKVSNNVYLYDRNLGRKSDIHEAIEFYKHSPYHSFRPVAMQSSK